jgi:hypothetical protein
MNGFMEVLCSDLDTRYGRRVWDIEIGDLPAREPCKLHDSVTQIDNQIAYSSPIWFE